MALFAGGSATVQTNTIGGTAHLIWTSNSASLGSVSPAATIHDVSIINTGTATCWVGGSSVTTAALPLLPGQQVTVQGWTSTTGVTTQDIYGITIGGGTQTSTLAGLASVASVV